jgi:formamidopyrimidine-DNA glycosylase
MPELPEVETVRATLAEVLPGRTVDAITTDGSERFAPAADALGATITSVRRAGKYLLIGLGAPPDGQAGEAAEDAELVIHLGMSGQLLLVDPDVASPRFRFRATLRPADADRDGEPIVLELRDVRGFGRASVVPVGDHATLGVLARLGPEPDDDDLEGWLVRRFAGRQVAVKALLLDQSVIGGVGNIYADEALHRAGVHPEARGGDLRPAAIATLSVAVRAVIAEGVANGGTTLRDYRQADGSGGEHQHHLAVYGRDGEPCATCGSVIVKIRVAGRGTHLCPTCQRRPRRRRARPSARVTGGR